MHYKNLIEISIDNNMYLRDDNEGFAKYLQVGLAGVGAICKELDQVNLWPKTILDMPSGYGRINRFINSPYAVEDLTKW